MGKLINKDNGLMTWADPGIDRPLLESMTTMCCHCGGHFELKPPRVESITMPLTPFEAAVREAQGKIVRGFCQNCNGYVCGPQCADCVPIQQMLENLENGRPANYRPIQTFVPVEVPNG